MWEILDQIMWEILDQNSESAHFICSLNGPNDPITVYVIDVILYASW